MGCTSSEIGGETEYVYECTVAGTVLAFEDGLLVQGRALRSEISHDGLPLGSGIYIRNVSFPLPYLIWSSVFRSRSHSTLSPFATTDSLATRCQRALQQQQHDCGLDIYRPC
jgi:hypothetical protein